MKINPYERHNDHGLFPAFGEITPRMAIELMSSRATVLISSPGGDIGSMLAMYDHIRHYEMKTFATGVCQSAAAVLLQAGALRIMSRNALLRFMGPEEENLVKEDDEYVDPLIHHLASNMANLVMERTGMALPEAYDLFDGKFINAERALALNLVDKIESREDNYVDNRLPSGEGSFDSGGRGGETAGPESTGGDIHVQPTPETGAGSANPQ